MGDVLMAEFEPVEFKSTIVRFTPASHAKMAAWAKASNMKRGEFIKAMMNYGNQYIKEKRDA